MKTITITNPDGLKVRINTAHIIYYHKLLSLLGYKTLAFRRKL